MGRGALKGEPLLLASRLRDGPGDSHLAWAGLLALLVLRLPSEEQTPARHSSCSAHHHAQVQ